MTLSTYSSREFTRDVSAAKRAAEKGPVFITDRGRPAYALLRIEDYYRGLLQAPRPADRKPVEGHECHTWRRRH